MKIAIVVPKLWYSHDRAKFSADLGCYIRASVGLGHEPLIVCLEGSEYCVDYPVKAVSFNQMECVRFWSELELDAGLVYTWMRHVPILHAMKSAGIYVVSKGDTEGGISARVFPKQHFQRMLEASHTPWEKACALRHWARRRRFLDSMPDREAIENIEIADKVSVDTHTAKCRLEQHLAFYGRTELSDKLQVIPPPLAEEFLTASLSTEKQIKITAIGRWDDPVKDAPLLKQTLALYLRKQPKTQISLIGGGGEKTFAPLCAAYPQVSILGVKSRAEIIEELANTRILLMTSRGESFHFASHEALSLGASVVGPSAVIPLPDICRAGPFGTEAAGRQPKQIAAALEQEMSAWNTGHRDPRQTAEFWRSRLSGDTMIRQMLESMPTKHTSRTEERRNGFPDAPRFNDLDH